MTERIRWSGETLRAPVSHCDGEVCITCSDEAVPVRILQLLPGELAIVDVGGEGAAEEVSVALVDAAVGDTVLVHAKEAIAVLGRGGGDGA
ncbi:MAG: hypothetical protein QOE54_5461 [Streptosporangiaceae bacterium]|nr:hypothetical protein [Streptosporangiaceae bacterium]MDX6433095.1 hypothetical protein [Streptosporangiaceae bacterium]